ncbi:hypothetical protein ONS95_008785 [Cadophora gregata]|uniref:uncharacterized protein n=1 Tax=Cadophora gregata TaxID=51156 RepID=UPI0026DA6FBA|nr:uncharacterized protein ONS95_008785 [Cadophora gregata]KAK0123784.1 hypothetical protein ONS95_008785 [Cadophora gregata]KAK0130128.1 hypothetical protein ONS96_000655 [Cadophora gregata f. sp. sojae]
MSRLWPHTPYAEDQPYHHAILATHVLTRAFQTGSLIGLGLGSSIFTLRKFNILPSKPRTVPPPPPSLSTTLPRPTTLLPTLLRSTSTGALTAFGLLCVGLPLQMRGKEEIEWRDRSWRLLENEGQVECDDWTYGGMVAGGLVAASKGSGLGLGWRGVVGGVGMGSVLGMLGYMGWRYGVQGGKRGEGERRKRGV